PGEKRCTRTCARRRSCFPLSSHLPPDSEQHQQKNQRHFPNEAAQQFLPQLRLRVVAGAADFIAMRGSIFLRLCHAIRWIGRPVYRPSSSRLASFSKVKSTTLLTGISPIFFSTRRIRSK